MNILSLISILLLLVSCSSGGGSSNDSVEDLPTVINSKLMYLDSYEKTISEVNYLGEVTVKMQNVFSDNRQIVQKFRDKYYFSSRGNSVSNPSELYSYDGVDLVKVSNFAADYESPKTVMIGEYLDNLWLLARTEEGDSGSQTSFYGAQNISLDTSLFRYNGQNFIKVSDGFVPNRGEDPLSNGGMDEYRQGDIFETKNYLWIKGGHYEDGYIFTVLRVRKSDMQVVEFPFAPDDDTEIWDVFIDHNEEIYLFEYWFDDSHLEFKKYDSLLEIRGPNLTGDLEPSVNIAFYHSFSGENSFVFLSESDHKLYRMDLGSMAIAELFSLYIEAIVKDGNEIKITAREGDDSVSSRTLYTIGANFQATREFDVIEERDTEDDKKSLAMFSCQRSTIKDNHFLITSYFEVLDDEGELKPKVISSKRTENVVFSRMTSSQNNDTYVGEEFSMDDIYFRFRHVGYWEGYPILIANKASDQNLKTILLFKDGKATKILEFEDLH